MDMSTRQLVHRPTVSTVRRCRPRRHTFWHRSLAEARLINDWYRVPKLYTRKTAAQIASDMRRAHERSAQHQRVRGLLVGERWESEWRPTDRGAPGDCEVWIRRVV